MNKQDFENQAAIKAALAEDFERSGANKLNAGYHFEALVDFSQAALLIPDNYRALLSCGIACLAMDNDQEAQDYFEQVLEINPDCGHAHYHLGMLHFKAENYELAAKNFSLFHQEEDSEDANFFFYRGRALAEIGHYEQAIESYSEALKFDNEMAKVYYLRSLAQVEIGNMTEAEEDYMEAITLEPELVSGFNG